MHSVPEPIRSAVKGFYRVNKKIKREELLKDLPVREFPCGIPEEDRFCDQCGTYLKEIGFVKVRDEIEYIPAKVQIVRYMQQACECLSVSIR